MSSVVGLLKHPTAVALIFDKIKLLETIADMISVLENPPTAEYASNTIAIVEITYGCCRCQFDKKAETIFKMLESTGIMEHYLRCAAIEGSVLDTEASPTFKELLTCGAYIRKSFKEGTLCGDTVRAIVKGTEGHSPSTRILPYMNTLIQLSAEAGDDSNWFDSNCPCDYCFKRGLKENLMCCSKCKHALYCSRECQVADWKVHKNFCPLVSSRDTKNMSASFHLVINFVINCYVHIMVRMVGECDGAGGLNFDEMVLELDMKPDASGTIPFMKDPPEFQIAPFATYLDGTRFSDPRYVFARMPFANETERKKYNKRFLAALKSEQSRRNPTQLLCVVSHERGFSCHCFARDEKGSQNQVYCQEAVDAFRSLMRNKDDSLLWKVFTTDVEQEVMLYQLRRFARCVRRRRDVEASRIDNQSQLN